MLFSPLPSSLCLADCCSQDDSLQDDTASLVSASSASVTDPNSSQSEAPTKKPKKKRKVSNFQGKLVIELDCIKNKQKNKQGNYFLLFMIIRERIQIVTDSTKGKEFRIKRYYSLKETFRFKVS